MADQVGHDEAKLMKKRQLRDGITARNSFLSVNYKENYQLIDCSRVSDVHCLGKFRVCFLPLLGCTAEENQFQKIWIMCKTLCYDL